MNASLPLAVAHGISKNFLATRALDDVSFEVRRGEVHALIGENGAGKSTLVKIFGGVHRPDAGEIRLGGRRVEHATPGEAIRSGIVVIPQEMHVVPARTVAENVLLGRIPVRSRLGLLREIDRSALRAAAAELVGRLDLEVDVDAAVGALGYAERQLVMIARALASDARILVLDEPTASLEAREVDKLFDVIQALKREGVGLIYVSHRLDEVERIADRVTVLRDGRKVGEGRRGEFTQRDMAELMTGRDLRRSLHRGDRGRNGGALLEGGGVDVGAGEVVGLAGLLGSGATDVLRRLYGAVRGSVRINGVSTPLRSPKDAIGRGLGLVPGERALGLVMGLTVRENVVLPNLARFARPMGLDRRAVDELVDDLMEKLDIRPRDPDRPVRELSGGNQQKVVFARWLAGQATVLLLDEPTHGIDVAAKAQIHRLMDRFAAQGGGILFASSELIEVISVSDRVIVLRAGEAVAKLTRDGEYTEGGLRELLGGR